MYVRDIRLADEANLADAQWTSPRTPTTSTATPATTSRRCFARRWVARLGSTSVRSPTQQAHFRIATIRQSGPALSLVVHLISLVERRSRACSFENAEVGLESDERELRDRVAWQSGRLAGGAARTAEIRPKRYDALARTELARVPRRLLLAWQRGAPRRLRPASSHACSFVERRSATCAASGGGHVLLRRIPASRA